MNGPHKDESASAPGTVFRDSDAPWRPQPVVIPPAGSMGSASRQYYDRDLRERTEGFGIARLRD